MRSSLGVDWAGKRWIVAQLTPDAVGIDAQPSIQAIWDQYPNAEQILIDIPIGLPDSPDATPRRCDEAAREFVAGGRHSSIFDVPCREAVQCSDHARAVTLNRTILDDETLGPQKWGFSERIHEADVFMRRTETNGIVRESHPEVCFTALDPTASPDRSKLSDAGLDDRLAILDHHEPRLVEAFEEETSTIEARPPWKRRIGIGMVDDIVDALVLAYTASLGSSTDFQVLGGGEDSEGLPMEIVYHTGRE